MAAENLKSTLLTNKDASPIVLSNPDQDGGKVRSHVATVEAAGGDAGSTYRLIRIRGDDRVDRLELATDDLGTSVTLNVGLYDVTDGAVEDADFFASAVDVATAAVGRTEITYESAVVAIENAKKLVFEQLSLADTPENRSRLFDIYATSVTAAATGTITMWAYIVSNDH